MGVGYITAILLGLVLVVLAFWARRRKSRKNHGEAGVEKHG
jgi:LPXTG-motif cell wall-anchored protein